MKKFITPIIVYAAATLILQAQSDVAIVESERTLPLAYDVDVVVAGGSLAGVEAAVAAAEKGGSVLLVDSRPYIGYDLCASQKLWLEAGETPTTALSRELFGKKQVVTPLEVKRALDRALLDHGVQFLTGTFPAELLIDKDGNPAGLTIVNRSGRQAVRAKIVIDATPDAALARQSQAGFQPFQPGAKEVQFIVVGGEPSENGHCREIPGLRFVSKQKSSKKTSNREYPIYQYTLSVPNESDTFRSRSRALNLMRSAAYGAGMVDHSERLLFFPDNPIIPAEVDSDNRGDLSPEVFRPKGIANLYVLSAYAGASDSVRKTLFQSPCRLAPVGRKIGIEAATRAKKISTPAKLQFPGTITGRSDSTVSEVAASFRFQECPQLVLPAHDLPVLGRWDVVVVGGGTSGAPAAIGASRSGARTLLIEYQDELGGVGTAGLVANYWYGLQNGFTAEVDKALGIEDRWWPTRKAEWLRSELMKANAEVWFGSFGCGAVMKGDKVRGVVVATPFGRGVVLADVVVDGTGNADIPAAAGAATQYSISASGDLTVQVAGYPDRDLGIRHNNTAYAMTSDADVLDRTHLLLTARQRGGVKNRNPHDMGQLIDTRDRRRIVGDYNLGTWDVVTGRTFPDTISHHRSNFDAGALPDDLMFLVKDMKGPVYIADMPYRCLIPKGMEGLLVTGLSASAHRDAMTLTRMQPDLQNQGYAAGVAAALAVRTTGGLVREINLKRLQRDLVRKGCLQERVLTDTDSFPMNEEAIKAAVKTLHALTIEVHQKREHDDTLPALAAVMGNPKRSIPFLKEAFENAGDLETRINFARILAVLGDPSGREVLLEAVNHAPDWGTGWDFSSQREKANSFGKVDRLVIALGFLQTPEVQPSLIHKLELLQADSPLSHYKAVCLALRLNKHKLLAEPLAHLLNTPGVKGHTQSLSYYAASGGANGKLQQRHRVNAQGGSELNAKFKEVLVAALLFECGDHQGIGREILKSYTRDVNGHFAAYAHHILTRDSDLQTTNGGNSEDGIIWLQPTDRTINEGEPPSLLVISKRPKTSYQWRRDGQPIAGATSNRLKLSKLTARDSGAKFDVVVRCPDGSEETSKAATITVKSPTSRKTVPNAKWASHADWNSEKPGYEWLFPFIDTNSDGTVTVKEYTRFQVFKKKSSDWQADVRKGGLK